MRALGLNSKKGMVELFWAAVVVVMLLVFAIAGVYVFQVLAQMRTVIADDPDMAPEAKAQINGIEEKYPKVVDGGVLVVLMLMWIGGFVTSLFFSSHPLLVPLTLIGFLIFFGVVAMLANYYTDVANDTDLAPYITELPVINYIMTNLLVIIVALGMSLVVGGVVGWTAGRNF